MRGAKPKLDTVIPMRGNPAAENDRVMAERARAIAKRLRPKGLSKEEGREWNRVAGILADPRLDRLKAHFVDAAVELVRVNLRLQALRKWLADNGTATDPLSGETYEVEGRNGIQIKSHPHVAQMNEAWRQWRSLTAMFGLNPTDERNLAPGQAGLFDGEESEFYS